MTEQAWSSRLESLGRSGGDWTVYETRDVAHILDMLEEDRLWAAYAIGDLEPSLFSQCRWVAAVNREGARSLVLLFGGLDPETLLLYGDPHGTALILGTALRPSKAYAIVRENQVRSLQAHYAVSECRCMLRMVRRAGPVCAEPRETTIRLVPDDFQKLQELYRPYAEVAFSAYQLADGVFYGLEHDGHLVAVAGTHLVSRTYGIAALGNVFTHPDFRGRGYSQACVWAVLADLEREVDTLVLNVGQENTAAQHVYKKFGFEPYCEYLEMMAYRQ